MDGWLNGWMNDGWMDGWTHVYICVCMTCGVYGKNVYKTETPVKWFAMWQKTDLEDIR